MRGGILLKCGKHSHDRIIALRMEMCAHKAILLSSCIKFLYQARTVRDFVYACKGFHFTSVSIYVFLLDVGTVQTA